jgi:hypothetical protein
MLPVTIGMCKRNGVLINSKALDKIKMDTLLEQMKVGDLVNVTYEVVTDKGSYSQISMVNGIARIIAADTGATFQEMKDEIKKRAGFYNPINDAYKSHQDMSKEELQLCINTAIQIADMLGCQVRV